MGERDDDYGIDFGDPTLDDGGDGSDIGGGDGNDAGSQAADGGASQAQGDGQRQQSGDATGQGSAPNNAPTNGRQGQAAGDGVRPGDAGKGNGNPQQPNAGQQQTPKGIRADDKGNLVDARGNIVAAAGPHRRLWEKSQHLEQYNSQLERKVAELTAAAESVRALDGIPQQMGVSMDDARLGINIVANFRKDPMSVAKWALQETMAMGYNLEQITGARGSADSINMQAVQRMLDERLGPVLQERQQAQQQSTQQRVAFEKYTQFLAKHEHADVHEETLATLIRQDPSRTPETAYWQLREWAVRNGLDFSQPLQAQLAARQQGVVQPQQQPHTNGYSNGHAQPANNAPQGMAPMPQGSASRMQLRSEPQVASPDEDWDRIVQSSLQEAGML